MEHPVLENCLERFASGKTTAAENRSLVVHLLRGCGSCSEKLAALLRPEVSPTSYDMALSRVERSLADVWWAFQPENLRPLMAKAS